MSSQGTKTASPSFSRLNLARKYRPKSLSELRGQAQAVKLLSEALRTDRVGPAYLFSGPRGVGKTSAARIFAKAATCLDPKNAPCEACDSCLAIQHGNAMHIIEIDGASHTGVDDVRSLIEAANYRPAVGRKNVYIVDEVHMLSQAAFNALLKTLEEPPSHVLFIFATTELQKIPETILSRVQRVELKRISEKEIIESLKSIAESEKVSACDEVLSQIAAAADGAFRDAQTLLEQVLILSGGREADPLIADQLLGTIGSSQEIKLMEHLARREVDLLLKLTREYFDRGKDLEKILAKLIEWARSLMTLRAAPQFKELEKEYPVESLQKLTKAFEAWSEYEIDRLFEHLWMGYERMKRSDLPLIGFETTLIRACRQPVQAQVMAQQTAAHPAAPQPLTTPSVAPQQSAPSPTMRSNLPPVPPAPARSEPRTQQPLKTPAAPTVAADSRPRTKEDLLQVLRTTKPSLYPLINSASQIDWKNSKLILHFSAGHFALQQLTEPTFKREVEAALTRIAGSAQSLELHSLEKQAATSAPKERVDFMKEAKAKAVTDPKVAKAAELLQGKVTGVTIEGVKT